MARLRRDRKQHPSLPRHGHPREGAHRAAAPWRKQKPGAPPAQAAGTLSPGGPRTTKHGAPQLRQSQARPTRPPPPLSARLLYLENAENANGLSEHVRPHEVLQLGQGVVQVGDGADPEAAGEALGGHAGTHTRVGVGGQARTLHPCTYTRRTVRGARGHAHAG